MTLPDPLYQTPTADPVSPPFDPDEGVPLPPGVTGIKQFIRQPNGYPPTRGARILNDDPTLEFYKDGRFATFNEIDGGRFNEVRRNWYALFKMYARFLWLNTGYKECIASTQNADWWVGTPGAHPTGHFGKQWGPVDAVNGPGAKQVTITWQAGDAVDPRQLTRASDGVANSSIMVSDQITDDSVAAYGVAQIMDGEWQGASGLDHSLILTLDKPLQAERSDQIWIQRENRLATFPAISLRYDTPVCKHAIKSEGKFFSSYKSAYPTAYVSDFIADTNPDTWWCDNMNDPTADPTCFSAACENIACPAYEAHVPFYPSDNTTFLWTRGRYSRQTDLTSNPPQFLFGRETWDGLYLLLGLPIGFFAGLHRLKAKALVDWGKILYETGETTDDGYTEFLSFFEQQEKRRANAELESDSGTILEQFSPPGRYDPAGGLNSTARSLVNDASRTPGYIAANGGHRRKSGGALLEYGEDEVGLSYGDNSVVGINLRSIQRVRPVRRNSLNITLNVDSVTDSPHTRVTTLATPETVPGRAEDYDVKIEVARFADKIVNSVQERAIKPVKGVTNDPESPLFNTVAKVYSITVSGDLLTVDLESFRQALTTYPNTTPGFDDVSSPFDTGGHAVAPDIAHRLWNPGTDAGVDNPGDPEALWIFPGDAIAFDAEPVAGIEIQCVAAVAFGGSTNGSAIAPHASLDGIPDYVRTNYAKRDRIILSLEGSNGALIKAWAQTFAPSGIPGTDVYIPQGGVRASAVSPPVQYYDGTIGRGFEPTLEVTPKATGTTVTVSPSNYVWDSTTGTFYLDTSSFDPGDYVFMFSGYVYDARKLYPCEDSAYLRDMVLEVCDKCAVELTPSFTTDGFDVYVDLINPTDTIGGGDAFGYSPGGTGTDGRDGPYNGPGPLLEVYYGSTIVKTYTKTGGGGPYGIGFSSAGEALGIINISYGTGGLLIGALGELGRFGSADIEQVLLDISYTEAQIVREVVTSVDGDTELVRTFPSTVDLSLIVFERAAGSLDDFVSSDGVGATLPLPTTIINEGGVDYLRGTVDATEAFKYILDDLPNEKEYLLLPGGPTSVTGSDIDSLAYSWITASYADAGSPPQNGETSGYAILFSDIDTGNLYVKTKGSALTDGPQNPYDSNGGFHDRPDMLYDPT